MAKNYFISTEDPRLGRALDGHDGTLRETKELIESALEGEGEVTYEQVDATRDLTVLLDGVFIAWLCFDGVDERFVDEDEDAQESGARGAGDGDDELEEHEPALTMRDYK